MLAHLRAHLLDAVAHLLDAVAHLCESDVRLLALRRQMRRQIARSDDVLADNRDLAARLVAVLLHDVLDPVEQVLGVDERVQRRRRHVSGRLRLNFGAVDEALDERRDVCLWRRLGLCEQHAVRVDTARL